MKILAKDGKALVTNGKMITPPTLESCEVVLNCDWYTYYAYTDVNGVGVLSKEGHTSFRVLKNSFLMIDVNQPIDFSTGIEKVGTVGYTKAYRVVSDAYIKYSI